MKQKNFQLKFKFVLYIHYSSPANESETSSLIFSNNFLKEETKKG